MKRRLLVANFILNVLYFLIFDKERRESCEHFKENDSKGPPVSKEAKPNLKTFLEVLRRYILRSTCNDISSRDLTNFAT